MTATPITDKVIAAYLAKRARSAYWERDRLHIERGANEARTQPWHVCWWTTNNGKREGWHVKCERDRHLSGTAYASFGKDKRADAQALCDAHNAEIAAAAPKRSAMDRLREQRSQARSDAMVRRHANAGNTSVRARK